MPAHKQFDREAALQDVMDAFWTRGFEATSMQDLVDCTGVNRASLYATYGDKRELFLEALHLYDEKIRRKMLSDLETRFAPKDAIRALLLAFSENISEAGGNRGCFLTNTALELAAHDVEIGKIVAKSQEDVEGFFARMIKQGKARGDIPANVKPGETARGLLASLIGLIVLTRSRPDRALLNAIVQDSMRRLC